MSGDQEALSFGDPNAQPPTPKETPNSTVFPSPVFETPKNTQGQFDDSSGWTPRFAEEYSVFNSTPGNLRASGGPFVPFTPTTPFPPSAGQKRPFSAEGIAAEIATHVNHFSPNPNLPLPPVAPSQQLLSSPDPLGLTNEQAEADAQPEPQGKPSKKARRGAGARKHAQGQTATPPPSSKKGRKLAPKLDTNNMQQHDQGFGQHDLSGTPQQPHTGVFVTTPSDMFGYPMSAPATAPVYTNTRPFWDPEMDPNMLPMDMDFSAGAADVFQTPTPSHRGMGSVDWGRTNEMFQDPGVGPEQNQENQRPAKRERPLAPKTSMPPGNTTSTEQMFSGSYPTPIDDPFGIVGPGGGVDPGLLFSRPQTASMDATYSALQPPSSSAPAAPQTVEISNSQPPLKPPAKSELRRSASVREMGPNKHLDRAAMISPSKLSGRPGLSRSFSENRGKRAIARASLPALAPAAAKPVAQQAGNPGVGSNRPLSQGPRSNGKSSPLKQHQRLSSLSSIPEAGNPQPRASVKFTIDANGRARVETSVAATAEAPPPPSSVRKTQAARPLSKAPWDSDDEDDSSSTDDEPIVIPSRNTSFAFSDARRSMSLQGSFHAPQRSFGERSTGGYTTAPGDFVPNDAESEAETVMNDAATPTGSGDAASELRKVMMQSRQRGVNGQPRSGASTGHRQRFVSGPGSFSGSSYHGNSTISPTTLTEASLPTPSTDTRGQGIRCVCNRPEADRDGDGFMVQCEACEFWLHGRCINITSKRQLPAVYVCAFCANTPMRGGRVREAGRGGAIMGGGGPGSVASPLAHKSFRSFR